MTTMILSLVRRLRKATAVGFVCTFALSACHRRRPCDGTARQL